MAEALPDSEVIAAILHQARRDLAALVAGGGGGVIDLGALAPGEMAALDAVLGTGEVTARVNACGEVSLHETATAGLWRVDHLGADGNATARFIEITFSPTLLRTQPEDAAAGLVALGRRLGDSSP